jgi:small subunit ribosomal protein S6
MERSDMQRPYELMYLVQPGVDEERLGAIGERIQQAIISGGGKIEKMNLIGRRRLSYLLGQHRDGIYAVVEFQIDPAQTREIERNIKLQEDILRHLIVRRDLH